MKHETVKLETVTIVTIRDFHAYFWRGHPPGYFDWGTCPPSPPLSTPTVMGTYMSELKMEIFCIRAEDGDSLVRNSSVIITLEIKNVLSVG